MTTQTWLTQEAADRLRGELETLETTGRTEIIKKIETASKKTIMILIRLSVHSKLIYKPQLLRSF